METGLGAGGGVKHSLRTPKGWQREQWGKMYTAKPTLESCGIQTDGKEPSKEQMPPSRES